MAISYTRALSVFQDPNALVIWMGSCRDTGPVAQSSLWWWELGTWELEQALALLGHSRESLPLLCLHPLSKLRPSRVCPCPSLHLCGPLGAWAVWDQSLFFRLQGWSGGLYGTRTQGLGEQWHHLTGLWLEGLCQDSATGHPGQRGARFSSCSGRRTLITASG